jgi:predicted GNAT family N-acyltransferase
VARKAPSAEYRVESLDSNHDRARFCCGVPELDAYLQQRAGQDQKCKLAAVFVLTADSHSVAGFYTLSAHSIQAGELPGDMANKLPRFPLPVTLLGRMAVDRSLQGKGWGEFLLMHALERALHASRQVASWAVIIDAKAGARDFYLQHDFLPLPANPDRLFLTMKTIEKIYDL